MTSPITGQRKMSVENTLTQSTQVRPKSATTMNLTNGVRMYFMHFASLMEGGKARGEGQDHETRGQVGREREREREIDRYRLRESEGLSERGGAIKFTLGHEKRLNGWGGCWGGGCSWAMSYWAAETGPQRKPQTTRMTSG